MQRALIASGVLGLGTALVFGAAAVTAALFPNGSTVAPSMNGVWMRDDMMKGGPMPVPMPMPMPPMKGGVLMDDGTTTIIDVAPAPMPAVAPQPTD